MAVTDINALRKWKKIPKDFRQRLLSNVFCITCFETTVVDYTLHDDEQGILITGKCKTCGEDVARLIEDA